MKIRDQQLEAFTEDRTSKFEQYMYDHLHKWVPGQCADLGPRGVQKRIHDGMDRAERYGIIGQRDLARFIDLTFALGPRFDKDSKHDWAGEILNDEQLAPTEKVDRLCEEASHRRRR
ncbi:MAG: hypothetical protein GY778_26705 [bacterium]|nr:hypothetical protein [bacterium]